MFNATFNNISVIPWRAVVLVEEVPGETTDLSQVTDKLYILSHFKKSEILKRKFKQRWSTIPPIQCINKTNNNPSPQTIKHKIYTMTYSIWNPCPGLMSWFHANISDKFLDNNLRPYSTPTAKMITKTSLPNSPRIPSIRFISHSLSFLPNWNWLELKENTDKEHDNVRNNTGNYYLDDKYIW